MYCRIAVLVCSGRIVYGAVYMHMYMHMHTHMKTHMHMHMHMCMHMCTIHSARCTLYVLAPACFDNSRCARPEPLSAPKWRLGRQIDG